MSKPRIAIPVPTSFDLEYNRRCWPQYSRAVEKAGGTPIAVELFALPAEIAKIAASCQGVLLPGSPADINPQKYGHALDTATSPADSARENVDELLLQDAHNLHKPIFGICYGAQSLNVWRGGTLVQDITIFPVNHQAGPEVALAHNIAVAAGSTFEGIVLESGDRTLPVNSSHHQAVAIPGDGLRVVARCTIDGVIEGIEGGQSPEHFVLGVQWHPERNGEVSESSDKLFISFIERCAIWLPRPVTASVA